MSSPFLSIEHMTATAIRIAENTGCTVEVVATDDPARPFTLFTDRPSPGGRVMLRAGPSPLRPPLELVSP